MRAVILGAAFVLALSAGAEAFAQGPMAPGGGGGQSAGGGGQASGGFRGGFGGRRVATVSSTARFDAELRAARRRGNDPSRDIWSGFRWNSDMTGRSGGRRGVGPGAPFCQLWRDGSAGGGSPALDCGRARALADETPGISVTAFDPRAGAQSLDDWLNPPVRRAFARPVIRRADGASTVIGDGDAPAATFAVRTVTR